MVAVEDLADDLVSSDGRFCTKGLEYKCVNEDTVEVLVLKDVDLELEVELRLPLMNTT